MIFPIPRVLNDFSSEFAKKGFHLFVVGGAVRDFYLGKKNNDFDFATDASPDDVISLFPKVIPSGIKHGTVTVLFKGWQFEVTTFRSEGNYSDSRHPDSVTFGVSLEEDLKRRDFTINALAVSLPDSKIIDLNEGIPDLDKRVIRCIGNPEERFSEDALRMMRACRFSAQLDFSIDQDTLKAMKKMCNNISNVSAERIQEEFTRILDSGNPEAGLICMAESGLMKIIIPELYSTIGVEQKGLHHEDVFNHSLSTLRFAVKRKFDQNVRMAAVFHDIGKPSCMADNGQRNTFHNHENVGAEITRKILKRLKYSNAVIDKVTSLVKNHMFNYSSQWTDGAVRRFILRCNKSYVFDQLCLRLADQYAICGSCSNTAIEELTDRIEKLETTSFTVNDLALNGQDLMKMGLKPGPVFSQIKEFLLEQVLDRPELNTKEELAKIAGKFISHIEG